MLKLCSHVRFRVPQQVTNTPVILILHTSMCTVCHDDFYFQILQGLVDVRIPHNDFYHERKYENIVFQCNNLECNKEFLHFCLKHPYTLSTVFMAIMGENSKYALHEHIQHITTPLQIIWGKQDQVCVENIIMTVNKNTHTHIPNIKNKLFSGCGCVWGSFAQRGSSRLPC